MLNYASEHILTLDIKLIISHLKKRYKRGIKKVPKKRTTYQKNIYLCNVLINK